MAIAGTAITNAHWAGTGARANFHFDVTATVTPDVAGDMLNWVKCQAYEGAVGATPIGELADMTQSGTTFTSHHVIAFTEIDAGDMIFVEVTANWRRVFNDTPDDAGPQAVPAP